MLRHRTVTVRLTGSDRSGVVFRLSAAVCVAAVLLSSCSSTSAASSSPSTSSSTAGSCNACSPPPPSVDVSVSARLNGVLGGHDVTLRQGASVALSLTMTVGRSDAVSSLQVGLVDSQPEGITPNGPCGVLTWVLQRQKTMPAGRYHFKTTFVAGAERGHDIQPMSVIA